jgi:hypothetical protein
MMCIHSLKSLKSFNLVVAAFCLDCRCPFLILPVAGIGNGCILGSLSVLLVLNQTLSTVEVIRGPERRYPERQP